jgi:hypothetical protein
MGEFMNEELYFVQKEGVYFHGVFWIGYSLYEAKKRALYIASLERDDYHEFVVYKYKGVKPSPPYDGEMCEVNEVLFRCNKDTK